MFLSASFSSSHFDISRDTMTCEGASREARLCRTIETVVLLKLLNTISVAPSNTQLDMLSSKC